MTKRFKIIKLILINQFIKGFIKHFGLFLDVVIAIMIVLKTHDNNRLVVATADLASICNLTAVVDLQF